MIRILGVAAALYSCGLQTEDGIVEAEGSVLDVSSEAVQVVLSATDPRSTGAVVASERHVVSVRDDGVMVYDLGGAPVDYDLGSPVTAATQLDGSILVGTSAGLVALDGTPLPPSLGDALQASIRHIGAVGNTLWVETGDGVVRWREGELVRIVVDGEAALGPMAVAPAGATPTSVWVAHEDRVLGLSDELEVMEWFPIQGPAAAVAVDRTGSVWVARDDGLTTWTDGAVGGVRLSGVFDVQASAHAEDVWVSTFSGAYVGTRAGLHPVSIPNGRWADVDALGNLLLVGDEGLVRASTAAKVRLLGLSEGLVGVAEVVVAVTRPEQVLAVDVLVGDSAVALSGPPWVFEIDAAELDGLVPVSAEVTWRDGPVAHAEGTVFPAAGVTWETGVQALYEVQCSACHAQGEPVELYTQNQWVASFDSILEEVESGRMPVGTGPLGESEIGLLKAWQATDFE